MTKKQHSHRLGATSHYRTINSKAFVVVLLAFIPHVESQWCYPLNILISSTDVDFISLNMKGSYEKMNVISIYITE